MNLSLRLSVARGTKNVVLSISGIRRSARGHHLHLRAREILSVSSKTGLKADHLLRHTRVSEAWM